MGIVMTKYFLGVDIGGTKSHALITDESGRAVGFATTGPGNYESIGWGSYRANLIDLFQKVLKNSGLTATEIAGAGFGVGGFDWPYEREPHMEGIDALGMSCPIELVNDAIIGLVAGASEGWGLAVIAGTGNNCRGRDRTGREGRTSGNGMLFGEFGGGGEMAWKALHAVVHAWSMRGPQTALTEAFIAHAGASDILDLLEGLQMERYAIGADTAPTIFQVAEAGDEVARGVIEWAALETASLACGVIRQLDFEKEPVEVVQVGGMFNGGPLFVEPFKKAVRELAPGAKFVRLDAPPVVGGVLLAMESGGVNGYQHRQRLIDSTREMMDG
jgi:N-acetylglucosamine kinase-like BadF-type ATPase